MMIMSIHIAWIISDVSHTQAHAAYVHVLFTHCTPMQSKQNYYPFVNGQLKYDIILITSAKGCFSDASQALKLVFTTLNLVSSGETDRNTFDAICNSAADTTNCRLQEHHG